MLSKLTVTNFLSFKEKTTFDLHATGYKVLTNANINNDVLKGLMFVGANASGKTNIIKALKMLLDLLFAEKTVDLGGKRCLFSEQFTLILEYEFQIANQRITYYIEYDELQDSLIEKLFVGSDCLINRIGSNAESKITDTKMYTDIDNHSLFLREIFFNTRFRNHDLLKQWFDFLLNSVFMDGYKEIIFSPGNVSLELDDYLKKRGAEEINDFFQKHNFHQRIEYSEKSEGRMFKIQNARKIVFFKRQGVGEPIPFALESLGNQKLIALLPVFFHTIKNGGMLIIDEFSSGLHNFLEELLVKYFMNHSSNAQLFLVSHSTNLLSNSLLRPDQIYAVDFKGIEGSKVKRFSSEQPRVAQNLEKMYTSGVFGGIPDFRDEVHEN
ncbi:ATP-binding protein [Paenibacillus athensensis]|uniref:ATPase n=1 Tax=Paenibacillus athensensis TaxID=1967502 RepID=A0A4Y8Q674_9BACL|nr:ATP-binding protein [Paenibacillus athensensis]MCD1259760.1 ATP-binding protein [Paenibacillus athensensis]